MTTDRVSEFFGVVLGPVTREVRRHRNAVHVFRADCVGGDHGTHRAVDTAAEPQCDGGETILGGVIADAHDEGVPNGFEIGQVVSDERGDGVRWFDQRDPVRRSAASVEVDQFESRFKSFGAKPNRTGGVQHRAITIENEVVLTADRVDVHNWCGELRGSGAKQRETGLVLCGVERRCVDNNHCIQLLCGEFGDWAVFAPQVFADEESCDNTAEIENERAGPWDEIALFVENGIGR